MAKNQKLMADVIEVTGPSNSIFLPHEFRGSTLDNNHLWWC